MIAPPQTFGEEMWLLELAVAQHYFAHGICETVEHDRR